MLTSSDKFHTIDSNLRTAEECFKHYTWSADSDGRIVGINEQERHIIRFQPHPHRDSHYQAFLHNIGEPEQTELEVLNGDFRKVLQIVGRYIGV